MVLIVNVFIFSRLVLNQFSEYLPLYMCLKIALQYSSILHLITNFSVLRILAECIISFIHLETSVI